MVFPSVTCLTFPLARKNEEFRKSSVPPFSFTVTSGGYISSREWVRVKSQTVETVKLICILWFRSSCYHLLLWTIWVGLFPGGSVHVRNEMFIVCWFETDPSTYSSHMCDFSRPSATILTGEADLFYPWCLPLSMSCCPQLPAVVFSHVCFHYPSSYSFPLITAEHIGEPTVAITKTGLPVRLTWCSYIWSLCVGTFSYVNVHVFPCV